MCGIFGYLSRSKEDSIQDIAGKALEVTRYRGPDSSGIKHFSDFNLVIGHNRLSIIDLSPAADQPMSSSDGKTWVVFNGEIYNFREIKKQLQRKGYSFRTSSDTEIIIYAYLEFGPGFARCFDGMFAIAIVDLLRKRILLCRDIAGEKPLFYYYDHGRFSFASELKQILVSGMRKNFRFDALQYYFAFGYLPHDLTFFSDCFKLPPSRILTFDIDEHTISIDKYWDVPDFEGPVAERDALDKIEDIFTKSVSRRLIADVPIGVFLSGGVDSSLTAALASKVSGDKIRTFTVEFEGSSRSEVPFARKVATHIGSDHTEISVNLDFAGTMRSIADSLDEPIYDSSIIPTFCLCKNARAYVKTALSGDGGDELFAGYIHYHSSVLCRSISERVPHFLDKYVYSLGSLLPEGKFGKNTLMSVGRGGGDECYSYQTQLFKNQERKVLLKGFDSGFEKPGDLKKKLMTLHKGDFVNRMCVADMHINLQEILVKIDRASMLNSLEVRTPFLNKELIEFSFKHLPGSLKMKNNIKKYILKKLAIRYLPSGFPLERKQGFDIPADMLEQSNLLSIMADVEPLPFLNEDYIRSIVALQRQKKGHYWNKLFALYMFKIWYLKWVN